MKSLLFVDRLRMIEVVTAAVSREAAVPLDALKKAAAADAAERCVSAAGWLPEVLRTAV